MMRSIAQRFYLQKQTWLLVLTASVMAILALLAAPLTRAMTLQFEGTLTSPAQSRDAPFAGFGSALDVDGNVLVIGAPWESEAYDESLQAGAAYVYEYALGQWQSPSRLVASDAQSGDLFGQAVAVEGNRIVIGAPWESDLPSGQLFRGAVYIFQRGFSSWNETARLDAGASQESFATFGHAVAVDGDRVAVGAPGDGDDPGAVFIFEYDGSSWSSTRLDGLAAGDRFGSAVAIKGDVLNVAERGGSSWRSFTKISGSWNDNGQIFDVADGFANAMAGNDARMAVGAPLDDEALFYSLESGAWQTEVFNAPIVPPAGARFGAAMALDGHYALIGAPEADNHAGAAYLYERALNDEWSQAAYLPGGSIIGQRFGTAVALDGTVLAIGAPGFSSLESDDGRVYLYRGDVAAAFSATPRQGCSPLDVTFTDESAGSITQRRWDVDGDGTDDAIYDDQTSFTHTFTGNGQTTRIYTARLSVNGAADQDESTIEVSESAVADFTAAPRSGSAPLTVTFTDQSTGPISQRLWDLDGDGQVDVWGNQTSVQFTFSEGTYSPSLEVLSSCGSSTRDRLNYIQVSAAQGPVILNPSFEDDGESYVGVGAISQGNTVSHWFAGNNAKAGRNPLGTGFSPSPFYDNGLGPDGTVAGYLKDTSFSQTISGFEAGKTYRLTFHVNSREAGAPDAKIIARLGGHVVVDEMVPHLEMAGNHTLPFHSFSGFVSPGAGSHTLEIEQDQGVHAALLIDLVEIEEAPNLVQNPSFEDDGIVISQVGAISQGNPVSHWTAGNNAKAGRNTQNGGNFWDNGVAADGSVVGYLKDTTYSQSISGFEAGTAYRITVHVNSRASTQDAKLIVRLDGQLLMDKTIPNLEGVGSHTLVFEGHSEDIPAGGPSTRLLEIEQDQLGHAALLIDLVEIRPLQ